MTLLDRLKTELEHRKELRTNVEVVTPSGDCTSNYTPEIGSILQKIINHKNAIVLPHIRKTISRLEEERIRNGSKGLDEICGFAERVRHARGIDINGKLVEKISCWEGDDLPKVQQIPQFAYRVCKAKLDLEQARMRSDSLLVCPFSYAFEPNQVCSSGLRFLLNEKEYRPAIERKAVFAVAPIGLMGVPHTGHITLMVEETDRGLMHSVKYICDGLISRHHRDKFDVVVVLDYKGNVVDIPHFEADLYTTAMTLITERKTVRNSRPIPFPEFFQYKRKRTGELEYELQIERHLPPQISIIKETDISNWNQIKSDMRLLGGVPLANAVGFVQENIRTFRNIYFKFRSHTAESYKIRGLPRDNLA